MPLNKKTVLFVDDDERVLRALEASFEDEFNVIVNSSANDALTFLSTEKVDILVSDQRMPEMLGYQLLSRARKVQPNTIRVLMTGYSDKQSIIETINKGEVFRFIAKPWKISEFKAILDQAAEASEAGHIELEEPSSDNRIPLNSHWMAAKTTVGYSPSVIMFTQERYRKALLQLASKSIDAKVFVTKSLDLFMEVISKNHDIGIAYIEINSLNADIISGLAMLRRARPEVVVIILTKASDFEIAVKLINHGQAFRYLSEPLDLPILTLSLRAALDRHVNLSMNKESAKRYVSDSRELSLNDRIIRFFHKLTGKKLDS